MFIEHFVLQRNLPEKTTFIIMEKNLSWQMMLNTGDMKDMFDCPVSPVLQTTRIKQIPNDTNFLALKKIKNCIQNEHEKCLFSFHLIISYWVLILSLLTIHVLCSQ